MTVPNDWLRLKTEAWKGNSVAPQQETLILTRELIPSHSVADVVDRFQPATIVADVVATMASCRRPTLLLNDDMGLDCSKHRHARVLFSLISCSFYRSGRR